MMEPSGEESLQQGPEVIPEGVSPVRYLSASGDGSIYLSYRTLGHALGDPDATMVFEADCGGQILLSCPVRRVRAGNEALVQLLTDLESITWGLGFNLEERVPGDAEIFFEHLPVRSGIAGGMGGGLVVDGVWLHTELEELGLRQQIESVIAGNSSRLDLPSRFPDVLLNSLAETRRFPLARVHLRSSMSGYVIVNCLASAVRVDEARLLRLIGQLDAVLDATLAPYSFLRKRGEPRLEFVPADSDLQRGGGRHVSVPLVLATTSQNQSIDGLERNRDAIISILAGVEVPIR